jgi:hypothetical protein
MSAEDEAKIAFGDSKAIIGRCIEMGEAAGNRSFENAKTPWARAGIKEVGGAEKKAREKKVGAREDDPLHRLPPAL